MLNERDAPPRACDLIGIISAAGDRYGSRLLDFMGRYGLQGLMQATEDQLREYIAAERLTEQNLKGV